MKMNERPTPRKRPGVPAWILYAGDVLLTWLALWLADAVRRAVPLGREIGPGTVYLTPAIFALVAGIWSLVFISYPLYESSHRHRLVDELRALAVAIAIAILLLAGAIYFTRTRDFSRLLVAYFFVFDLAFLLAWRWATRVGMAALGAGRQAGLRTLIIGNGPTAVEAARRMQANPWAGFHLVGFLSEDGNAHCLEHSAGRTLGRLEDAADVVARHDIECVVIALSIASAGAISAVIRRLAPAPVTIYVVPDYVGLVWLAPRVEDLYGVPLIRIAEPSLSRRDRVLKRLMDLLLSILALILLLPLGIVIAVAIRLDSAGPIFFVQPRVGQGGRRFNMYKFRSMVADAPHRLESLLEQRGLDAVPLKLRDDPRVTRVGRILRRTSLDELPQFLNVLKGEMSLVGPRPEEPRIVQGYDEWQRKRLSVKPGITGPMQVSGRGDLPLDDRVRLELDYIQHYSLLEDIRLLLLTLPAIISGKGSY